MHKNTILNLIYHRLDSLDTLPIRQKVILLALRTNRRVGSSIIILTILYRSDLDTFVIRQIIALIALLTNTYLRII
jgi:hypothetical protein